MLLSTRHSVSLSHNWGLPVVATWQHLAKLFFHWKSKDMYV